MRECRQRWKSPRRQNQQLPQAVWKQPSTRSPTRHARDRVAGRDDRADVLVADREARLDLHAAVEDVQVRAAHARRLDPDDRVVGVEQLGLGAILDADHAGGLEGDGSHRLGGEPTGWIA